MDIVTVSQFLLLQPLVRGKALVNDTPLIEICTMLETSVTKVTA